jgi:uncharacterized protein YrrD
VTRPVSWFVIARGWPVYAGDGEQLGRVEEVVGEPSEDIFNGLVVATGFFSTRYVPAERVQAISEGRVDLDLTADEVDALPKHAPSETR